MKISILTATYNRAKCLPKLFESIKKNASNKYDIEWLIMDDGSTDNTKEVIEDISGDNVEIKYFTQSNQGKMAAINNLAKYVTGEIWIECDSDDYFADDAFEKIIEAYEKNKNRADIYALAFLKYDQNGKNMGSEFKAEYTTMFDLYFKQEENGEKALAFISDIRKNYKYELENNERFVTEARMYHKMDLKYKMACYNDCVMICEYQDEGYTKNISKQFIQNPNGYYWYFYEILTNMDFKGVKLRKRMYAIKHYILFSYLTRRKCKTKGMSFTNSLLVHGLWGAGVVKARKFEKS